MTDHTSHIADAKRLERSDSDRILYGVAGGLARYFDIHPTFFRVGFVMLTLLDGSKLLIYTAAALVMPAEGAPDSIATRALRQRRDRPWPLIGLGLLAVAGAVVLSNASFWPHGDVWVVLAIAGVAILFLTRHGLPERRSVTESGVAAALARDGSHLHPHRHGPAPRPIGSVVALILVATAIAAAVFHVHIGNGIGDREYTVTSVSELDRSYELGIGTLRLDLSQLSLPANETRTVKVRVDIGDTEIIVPAGVALHANARARAGDIRVLGDDSNGWEVEREASSPGSEGTLIVDAEVGAGSIRIDRAVP